MDNATAPRPARSGYNFPRYDARLHDGDEVQLESIHQTWLVTSFDPQLTLRGRTIALQASSGKYCGCVLGDPKGRIRCNNDQLPFSAWFEVSNDTPRVSLRGLRVNRFCIDEPDGVTCNQTETSNREDLTWLHATFEIKAFEIKDAGDGNIHLQGRQGFFCMDEGYGLVCNRRRPSRETAFKPIMDETTTPCIKQTEDQKAASAFVVQRKSLDSPSLSLLCKGHGHYLAVNSKGVLGCSSKTPWMFSAARVPWWDSKSTTFQSHTSGLFLKALEPRLGTGVFVDNKEGTGWALWRVRLVGGYEFIRPLIRGVNLGNWFLVERWMADDLFYDKTGQSTFRDQCTAMDEFGLMKALGQTVAKQRMEHHWSTWIMEEDIAWLSDHGINTVRVPFGYWMVFPDGPFVEGQLKYLDLLFQWCERHSISVLLDFHGLKGSQTGSPTSGNCGACGHPVCGKTHVRFLDEDEQATNLRVIDNLTRRYSASPAYLGFAVANEVSGQADSKKTMAFYQKAYDLIREKSEDSLIVFFATFNPSTYPFPNFQNVVEDIHVYFGMGFGHPVTDEKENLQRAYHAMEGLSWHCLIGEWSLGGNGHTTEAWPPDRRQKFFAGFGRMQLQAWETYSTGWFYWSYKTRFPNSTWNFRDMCNWGWLPGCTKELVYAPENWWEQPVCAYAYLDGNCPAPSYSTTWLILAIFCVVAGAAVILLRPAWVLQAFSSFSGFAATATTAVATLFCGWIEHLGWQNLAAIMPATGNSAYDNDLDNNNLHDKVHEHDTDPHARPVPEREPLADTESLAAKPHGPEQPFIW